MGEHNHASSDLVSLTSHIKHLLVHIYETIEDTKISDAAKLKSILSLCKKAEESMGFTTQTKKKHFNLKRSTSKQLKKFYSFQNKEAVPDGFAEVDQISHTDHLKSPPPVNNNNNIVRASITHGMEIEGQFKKARQKSLCKSQTDQKDITISATYEDSLDIKKGKKKSRGSIYDFNDKLMNKFNTVKSLRSSEGRKSIRKHQVSELNFSPTSKNEEHEPIITKPVKESKVESTVESIEEVHNTSNENYELHNLTLSQISVLLQADDIQNTPVFDCLEHKSNTSTNNNDNDNNQAEQIIKEEKEVTNFDLVNLDSTEIVNINKENNVNMEEIKIENKEDDNNNNNNDNNGISIQIKSEGDENTKLGDTEDKNIENIVFSDQFEEKDETISSKIEEKGSEEKTEDDEDFSTLSSSTSTNTLSTSISNPKDLTRGDYFIEPEVLFEKSTSSSSPTVTRKRTKSFKIISSYEDKLNSPNDERKQNPLKNLFAKKKEYRKSMNSKVDFEIVRGNLSSSMSSNSSPDICIPKNQKESIIQEIVFTERDYVHDLEVVLNNYIHKLADYRLLRGDQKDAIFGNFEDLIPIHKSLLAELEAEYTNPNPNFSPIFEKYGPQFEVYARYCFTQSSSKEAILRYSSENPNIQLCLEELKTQPEVKKLDLESYLIKPLQRLCKYPLLLRELKNATDEKDESFTEVDNALNVIAKVVNQVNETKRKADNLIQLCQIQDSIIDKDILLQSLDRYLVKEVEYKKVVIDNIAAKLNIWIFNDLILLAKRKEKNRFLFRTLFPLNQNCTLFDLESHSTGFGLGSSSKREKTAVLIYPPTIKEKTEIMELLSSLIAKNSS